MIALAIAVLLPAALSAQTADLAVTSVSFSTSGRNVTVSATIANLTSANVTTTFQVGYFISKRQTPSTTDIALGTFSIPGLAGNASFNDNNRTLPIPLSVPPGNYFLACIADTRNQVVETNKTNDTAVAAGNVDVLAPAALTLGALSAPSTVRPGGSFTASFQVANTGQVTFDLSSVNLAYSGSSLTTSPVTVPPSIAGGTTATYSFNVSVPSSVSDFHLRTASVAIFGTDAASGATVSAANAAAGNLRVLSPATIAFTDAGSNPVSTYNLGVGGVFVTLTDADQNTSASTQQSVIVTITSSSGDREQVILRETANDSGIFRNLAGVPTANTTPAANDGTIEVTPGGALAVSYVDPVDATDHVTAAANVHLVPTKATGSFTNASGAPQFFYSIGIEPVFVTLADADRNLNPNARDTVNVTVTDGATGDQETLLLTETGNNTGVFRNLSGLPSVRNQPASNGDNVLETADGSTIKFVYTDPGDPTDITNSTAVMLFRTKSTTRFTNQSGGAIASYTLGLDKAFVTVIDADRKTSVPVVVQVNTTGDIENVTLPETGIGTGIFRNTVGIPIQLGGRSDNDGTLDVTGGAVLKATYTDPGDATDVTSSTATVVLQQTQSQTSFTDSTGAVEATYAIGGAPIFVTVTDADQNTDPNSKQTVQVNVVDGVTGDLEVLTLTETGNSTGVFRNTTGLLTVIGPRKDNDGVLETANLSNLSVNYQDPNFSGDTSFAFATMQTKRTTSSAHFTDANGVLTTQFRISVDPVFVTVADADQNTDPNTKQQVSVLVRNQRNGDKETLVLTETDNNSGIFRNTKPLTTAFANAAPTTGDGILEGRDGDSCLAQYVDPTDPNDFSTGIMSLRFQTPSQTRLTDRDGNKIATYVVPRDSIFVTVTDLDRQSPTTGTLLPAQVDYDSQVQVIFDTDCWKCHSPSGRTAGALPPGGTPAPNQGGLNLAGYQPFLAGGNNPPDFISGNGAGSLLIRKLTGQAVHQGGSIASNPAIITTAGLQLLQNWIDQGAIAPTPPTSSNYTNDLEIPLFHGRCDVSGCHDSGTKSGNLDMTPPSQAQFVANGRITPGDGPDSKVVRLLNGQLTHTGSAAGLTSAQIDKISVWISQRVQDTQPAQRLEYTGAIQPLFNRSCANSRCHGNVNPSGNLDLTNYKTLVLGGTNGNPTIPGDGPDSLLVKEVDGRMNHTGGFGDPPLSAAETQELVTWINQGATAPPNPPASQAPVTTNSVTVTVSDAVTGDQKTILLRELANSLGTFRNTVGFPTQIAPAAHDNHVDTAGGSTLTALYQDPGDPSDTRQDTAKVALTPTGSITEFTDSLGNKKTNFAIGATNSADQIFITVTDADRNLNPLAIDFVNVTLLDSVTGDSENVLLRETGPNTGVFRNGVGFRSKVGLAVTDGILETAGGSTITANYTDPGDSSDFSFDLARMFATPGPVQPQVLITNAAGMEITSVPITLNPSFPTFFATVIAPEENTNASVEQTLTVTATSPRKTLTFSVRKTSTNTSTFRNPVGIPLLLGNGNPNSNALEAFAGDLLSVKFFSKLRNQVFTTVPGRYTAFIPPGNSTIGFTDASGSAQTTFPVGASLFITLNAPDRNTNPNVAEAVTVVVTSTITGDSENVLLVETGCNTGVFRNVATVCLNSAGSAAPLTTVIAVPVANDGILETADKAVVTVSYQNPNSAPDHPQAVATMIVPAVQPAVAFIDKPGAAGLPVGHYFIGTQKVFVRVTDPSANTNPLTTQVVQATVTDPNTHDFENVTLLKRNPSSSIFENLVGLPMLVSTAAPNDGIVDTQDGSRIVVTYQDSAYPMEKASAAATVAVTATPATTLYFSDANGMPHTGPYIIGNEGVFVTVADADRNTNPSVRASVLVTLSDLTTGDHETITCVETSTDSGIFRNIFPGIPLRVDAAHPNDGVLQTAQASTLIATYSDPVFPPDTLTTVPTATTSRPALIGFPVFTDATDNPVNSYIIGLQPIFIRIVDLDQNANPLVRETITGRIRLTSRITGDTESVSALETTSNSGVFRNVIGLPTRLGPRSDNDGVLDVGAEDTVTVQYTDIYQGRQLAVTTQTVTMHVQRTAARVILNASAGGPPVTRYRIGKDPIFVTVEDCDQNLDPNVQETVQVTLRDGGTGDTEIINLRERGTNSCFFDSITGIPSLVATANSGDGSIEASGGSTLTASYIDRTDLTDRAQATAGMAVPKTTATIAFTDVSGTPVSNYRIGVDPIFVTINDPGSDTDPSAPQSILVTLTDTVGDRLTMQLAKTSFNSTVFRNLNIAPGQRQPVLGQVLSQVALPNTTDSILQTLDGDTVTASYLNQRDTGNVIITSQATMKLAPTTNTVTFTNDLGQPVQFYTIGISGTYVTVKAVDQNRDPRVREQLTVQVSSSPVGDQESLTLTETTSSSAIFRNSTPLSSVLGPRILGDGILESSDGGIGRATFSDPLAPTNVASATVQFFVNPSSSTTFFTRSAIGSLVATDPGYAVDRNESQSEQIFVEVHDSSRNTDPNSRQTVIVNLSVLQPNGRPGDTEQLTLTEINNNSDTFRNTVGLPSVIGPFTSNDSVLETTPGATLVASYQSPSFAFDKSEYRVRTNLKQTAALLQSTDANGTPKSSFLVGTQPIFAQVTDADVAELLPSVRQTVKVTYTSALGDQETLTALETGTGTGVFLTQSGMQTVISSTPHPGNGILEVSGAGVSEGINIRYADPQDPGDAPQITAQVVYQTPSTAAFVDGSGNPVTSYVRGRDGIILQVTDLAANRSAAVAETVTAAITDSSTQDREVVNLVETGLNTGVFSNAGHPLLSVLVFPPNPLPGDGVLEAGAFSHTIQAIYRNTRNPADNSSASASLVPANPLDSDGDGIPDAWEIQYGLNPADPRDAQLIDPSSGQTYLQDYLTGTIPNSPFSRPIAAAGQSRSVDPGQVSLDGSASTSPKNLPLTYTWTQVSGPATVSLQAANTAFPNFLALTAGAYVFQLVVNNGKIDSFPGQVTITVNQLPPVADAGPPLTVDAGSSFALHGEASRDPNNGPLTYSWSSSLAGLTSLGTGSGAQQTFRVDTPGYYPLSLTVSDAGGSASASSGLIVNGEPNDRLPTADPGVDFTGRTNTVITLDGTGSASSDGGTLAYIWTFLSGPEPESLTASGPRAIFSPLTEGYYQFQLVVTDTRTGFPVRTSAPAFAHILVNGSNLVPTADAGSDQNALTGARVVLDGRASADGDGDPLTYTWTQVGGSSVPLSSNTSPVPSFVPVLPGVATFQLVVNDGRADSKPALVHVRVDSPTNHVPVANAGADSIGVAGTSIALNGSNSFDQDGTTLSFLWTQRLGANVTLSGQNGPNPSFTPAVPGLYAFDLVVSDGVNLSEPSRVQIAVNTAGNHIPVANAGTAQTVFLGSNPLTVNLDGRSSSDPDGNTPLTYTWSQTGGTNVSLLPDAHAAAPSFVAPLTGNYKFSLVVRNSTGLRSKASDVVITVVNGTNSPPLARINGGAPGGSEVVRSMLDSQVLLDASASASLNGSTLTFMWTQVAGPPVVLSSRTSMQVSFIPRVSSTYAFKLTVTDGNGNSSSSLVTVFAGNSNPGGGTTGGTTGGSTVLGSVPAAGGGGGCGLGSPRAFMPLDLVGLLAPLALVLFCGVP